jgi:LL-diaminopimelate aminotransferase
MKRNPNFAKVAARYFFPEIIAREKKFLEANPDAKLIKLGIGDTTEPLTPSITDALVEAAEALGTRAGYVGYGPEEGHEFIRKKIRDTFYEGKFSLTEIFVSDGAASDIGRLQLLFGQQARIAIQDPSYPAVLDTTMLANGQKVILLPCNPKNDFFPNLDLAKDSDVLFLCSPNNPTAKAFSYEELEKIVSFAIKFKKIIAYDSAYSCFIQGNLPRSIYEIRGADGVAIEIGSFSKMAGFTGLRLGWTVVPDKLRYDTGEPIHPDWARIVATFFNGASIISQHGGAAALSETGQKELAVQTRYYLDNIALLKSSFEDAGFETYGGIHAPYLWVRLENKSSWDAFDELLEKVNIVTCPGCGFGEEGEGFLRVSGFVHRADIQKAAERLRNGVMAIR